MKGSKDVRLLNKEIVSWSSSYINNFECETTDSGI